MRSLIIFCNSSAVAALAGATKAEKIIAAATTATRAFEAKV
jgi:hypothetical protein